MFSVESINDRVSDIGPARLPSGGLFESFVAAGKPGAALLHPRVLEAKFAQNASSTGILTLGRGIHEDGRISSAAVLSQKNRRFALLPGLRYRARLAGFSLIGDQILGCNSEGDLCTHRDSFAQILARPEFDFILLENIETRSELFRLLSQRYPGFVFTLREPPQPRWMIKAGECAGEYWGKFSSKTRSTWKRKAKGFKHRVRCFEDACESAEFAELASAVSKGTWQSAKMGLRIRADEATADYYKALSDIGAFRSYVLFQEEMPIAFIFGHQWNGSYVYEEAGYLQEYARYSPGLILLLAAIDDLLSRKIPKVIDFGFGDAGYKRMFANESCECANVVLFSTRLRPKVVARCNLAVALAREVGKRVRNLGRGILRSQ